MWTGCENQLYFHIAINYSHVFFFFMCILCKEGIFFDEIYKKKKIFFFSENFLVFNQY